MINTAIVWFVLTQYYNNRVINIKNLLETLWMIIYPFPVEITYINGS